MGRFVERRNCLESYSTTQLIRVHILHVQIRNTAEQGGAGHDEPSGLDSQLGASPVSSLGVVPGTIQKQKRNTQVHNKYNYFQIKTTHEQSFSQNKPDGVASPHANPVGNRSVLLHLDSKSALSAKGLLGRHRNKFTLSINYVSSIQQTLFMTQKSSEQIGYFRFLFGKHFSYFDFVAVGFPIPILGLVMSSVELTATHSE